ncbi:efflux RND transporter periplasmic adaptor subunit [Roseibacterium sp. SDUM158017]|uniref:efflux RND transporter periplasmic adaptor subunit n=1 Tax=Roseicyclus salinarum TaxID=3036773 RepID=UPI002414F6AF|nr:efflux RND transporter periplasmic adaptor subunit [Roseibacterium sp. SDUM158017]MDG4648204.1 efflux RND transporter periplasmic adaptor subunit [Roseibacterium sp. SDUM158017]
MNFLRQTFLGLLAVAAAVAIWAFYVPSAAPYLERAGIYDIMGIDAPAGAGDEGGGRRFGGGASQVVVAEVATGQVNARVSAIGDGRAARSVTVRSEATGLIRELSVMPGRYVEEGAVIALLDDDAERIALERARLSVADTEGDVERLQQLSASGAVSAVQLRSAELAFRSAELEVAQAEFDLAQRRIVAPISGWVGLLEVEEGDRIGAQDAIAVITDRSTIQIDFRVPERHIAQLSVGMPLEVIPLARPDEVLQGEIVALDNVVERASRTLRVQGRVENADDTLRAGQAFEVALSFPGDSLPSVDPLAIQWSGDGAFVWAARDGEAVRVPVVIRQRNSDSVLVEAALSAGDLVVIEGVQTLRSGGAIEIVTGASAAEGDTAAVAASSDI